MLAEPVFAIIDLGELPKVEGVECDGLVGYEMFRRFGVTIDYAGHALTLAEPAKFAPPAGASVVPFELDDRIPIVAGTLDGVPMRISVDTGSRSSLTMHSPFVREHDLVEKYHAAPEAVVGWGVGGPSRGRPARFGTLMLGDREDHGHRGRSLHRRQGRVRQSGISGNLGGGVLQALHGRVRLRGEADVFRAECGVRKARRVRSQRIVPHRRKGCVLVADVAPESAAARAGWRRTIASSRSTAEGWTAKSLVEWRAKLRELPVGTKLEVESLRDGKKADASSSCSRIAFPQLESYRRSRESGNPVAFLRRRQALGPAFAGTTMIWAAALATRRGRTPP